MKYLTRILALPLVIATIFAFTFKTKTANKAGHLAKTFTVIIDAGHGKMENGSYNGAKSNDLYEDDIVLNIAQRIASLNANPNLNIVLSRKTPSIVDLKERVAIAKENKADLFVSVHLAADEGSATSSGIDIYVSNKNTPFQKESESFGSIMQSQLNNVYPTKPYLQKRQVGIWVLDQNVCPSVLVECGYITNQKDLDFITKSSNQEEVAKQILQSIESYAASVSK